MKKLIVLLLALMPLVGVFADKTEQTKSAKKETVVLSCDIHCQGCCDKIMKNIAFEKGVKDIVCDLKTKTVTVTFDPRKTDVETLLKAFERIKKPAEVVKDK
jgi:copper chaperone CopZ